ncbi:MAG: phenylalanine--tRNA ligase subunit alpha, partial [Methanothrix sp.]|nr:phenylalanine--tRNA ligase subunit alpha [Methanothrix sp.]
MKAISEGDSDPQSIADKLGMKIEAVRASADALGEQDLIKVTKSVAEFVSLTEEGTKYAKEGLPERNLLQSLGSGKSMSELKDPALKIGLGWLRNKGWAAIDKGIIRPLGSAPKGKDEEILVLLLNGPMSKSAIESNSLSDLKNRGLVKSDKSKSWSYEITDAGQSRVKADRILYIEPANINITISDVGLNIEIGKITSEMIKTGKWFEKEGTLFWENKGKMLRVRPYDVTLAADRIVPGKKHPYQRLIDFMREIMLEMGFVEIKGQIVQSSFWNFDALFQPQDHPAREMQDTFYLDSLADIPDYTRVKEMHECGGAGSAGWGGCWKPEVARQEVLRTHTTG